MNHHELKRLYRRIERVSHLRSHVFYRKLAALLSRTPRRREANAEAAVWPALADTWLRKVLG